MITVGSLFTGIGGFDLACERSGTSITWQAEIDRQASQLLEARWPGKNLGDVHDVTKDTAERVDLICGGFPCQDVSVAGQRAGLAGSRSGLWFEFARVIDELEPGWVVIENVPGLLSSNRGRDFAAIIQWLAERGYGVAWRVFDAQYFGLAQRRKRVFVVASLGNGRAAEVLFERESSGWYPPARREAGQDVAGDVENSVTSTLRGFGHGWQGQHNDTNAVISFSRQDDGRDAISDLAPTMRVGTSLGSNEATAGNLAIAYNIQQNDGGNHKRQDRPNGGMYVSETDTSLAIGTTDSTLVANTLSVKAITRLDAPTIWHNHEQSGEVRIQGATMAADSRHWGTGGGNVPFVGVRRLTPTECERLQGFPDGWTAGFSDSTRYKMLGNAVAVPVVEWIIKRIAEL